MRYILLFVIIFLIVCKCMAQSHPAKWYGTAKKTATDTVEVLLHVDVQNGWWIYFPNKHFTISKKPKQKNIGVYAGGSTYVDKIGNTKGFSRVLGGDIEMVGHYKIPKSIKESVSVAYPYTVIDSATGHYTNHIIYFILDVRRNTHHNVVDTFIALPGCRCGSEFDF